MYDLKNFDPISENVEKNNGSRDLSDRSYFNSKITSSILNTKSSYIPSDELF